MGHPAHALVVGAPGSPPVPPNERERLRALQELCILDTPAVPEFDRITRLARCLLRVPIALVSLVDADRQWFKSRQGLAASETPRDIAFCAHAILSEELFVVPDAALDPRFACNPLVVGQLSIRFYAGRPLRAPSGHLIGTLCIIDHVPRQLDAQERQALDDLACLVEEQIAAQAVGWRLVRSDEQRRRFQTLAECSPVGVFETDANGACTYTNARWLEITGLGREESLGAGWVTAIHPEDRAGVSNAWSSAALDGCDFSETFRFLRPSGEVRWVRVQAAPVLNAQGEVLSWVGVDEDITNVRAMQQALVESESRFRQFAQAIDDVFWIIDRQTLAVLYLNPAYERVWQQQVKDVLNAPSDWLCGVHAEDRERACAALFHACQAGEPFEVEFRIVLRDGGVRHVLNRGFPVFDADGSVSRLAGVASDMTSLHHAREELQRLASVDALTGVPNSRTFHELLVHELQRSRRTNSSVSVAFVDIDHFKSVNDSYGHAAGDAAIRAVALGIRESLRASDVLARIGGDEFCIILPDCDEAGAEKTLAEVVRRVSVRRTVVDADTSLSVTLSVGVAATRGASVAQAELLKHADIALYEAKQSGRNRVCVRDSSAPMPASVKRPCTGVPHTPGQQSAHLPTRR